MRFVMFYHSLVSDWNHGNAHFLRGVVGELLARGHQVDVYEPRDSWSLRNLLQDQGPSAIERFRERYPTLRSRSYDLHTLELDVALNGADVVIAHEWNDPQLITRLSLHRATVGSYKLLFHDTHHRCVTEREAMARYDLSEFDGVLAFGRVIREIYLENGWAQRAWVWHEAADHRVFKPMPEQRKEVDLTWIGNWGDDERTAELSEFLIEPVKALRLRARVHGVRYPQHALQMLQAANIQFAGWLANFDAPLAYARASVTVHVPRRPYTRALPGIPTIRVFEALACGIPLISAPWHDIEQLFTAEHDYIQVRDGAEMQRALRDVLSDRVYAAELSRNGRQTILARHTCAHRVNELLSICRELGVGEMPSMTAVQAAP